MYYKMYYRMYCKIIGACHYIIAHTGPISNWSYFSDDTSITTENFGAGGFRTSTVLKPDRGKAV